MQKLTFLSLVILAVVAISSAKHTRTVHAVNSTSTTNSSPTTTESTSITTTIATTEAITTESSSTTATNATTMVTNTTSPTTSTITTAVTTVNTTLNTTVAPTNTTTPEPTTMPPTMETTSQPTLPTRPTTVSPTTVAPETPWMVKDTNGTTVCILAKFRANFTIPYNLTNNETTSVTIGLPRTATTVSSGSFCSSGTVNSTQQIKLQFPGKNHFLSIRFHQNQDMSTDVDQITFEYDLSDDATFPNASYKVNDSAQAAVANRKFAVIPKDEYYYCSTGASAELTNEKGSFNVTTYFSAVEAQAFRTSNTTDFDGNAYTCPWDPTNITTTMAPVTSTTPQPKITTANYTLVKDNTTCLFAQFGLSVALQYKNIAGAMVSASIADVNNGTVNASKSMCGNDTSLLWVDHWIPEWHFVLNFTRNKDSNKFNLAQVTLHLNLKNSSVIHDALNTSDYDSVTNLDSNVWSATVGHSYKCKNDDNWKLSVTGFDTFISQLNLQIHDVQVQAFMNSTVINPTFGDVEECPADFTSDIVPIAVGCALAALVVIVLIAYVIGRRRNRARGYESM